MIDEMSIEELDPSLNYYGRDIPDTVLEVDSTASLQTENAIQNYKTKTYE